MLKNISAGTVTLSVIVSSAAFGQETTLWEYDAGGAVIGHFEVTPLGSIFVGRGDRAVVLDQDTGEAIWDRADIQRCRQRVDNPDTSATNEADGTIRCQVDGMRPTGFLADKSGARFSTIPYTDFGVFEVGFRGLERASDRYMVLDLATGSTLWDSRDVSLERTRGFLYVPQLNQFLLSGEDSDERGLIAAVNGSDGELLWQREIDILDRFKFIGTPNNTQVLVYRKMDSGHRSLVSIELLDGAEQWRLDGFLQSDARNRNVLLEANSDGTCHSLPDGGRTVSSAS